MDLKGPILIMHERGVIRKVAVWDDGGADDFGECADGLVEEAQCCQKETERSHDFLFRSIIIIDPLSSYRNLNGYVSVALYV